MAKRQAETQLEDWQRLRQRAEYWQRRGQRTQMGIGREAGRGHSLRIGKEAGRDTA